MYDCCILVCTTFRCRHFPKKTESTFLLMVVVIIKGNVCVSDRFVTKNCEKINREVREVHFWGTLLRRLGAWPRAYTWHEPGAVGWCVWVGVWVGGRKT